SFAAEKPLMIVVEDLHWIDPTSRQLLTLLIDQVPTVPLFMLLTARPDFEHQLPTRSYLTDLTLNRLAENEVEEMSRRLAARAPLPREVVDEIVRRADGVPLFVEELVKAELDSQLLRAESGRHVSSGPVPALAMPPTLQDLLAARLNRLSSVKPFAQLCATLGREFPYSLLR